MNALLDLDLAYRRASNFLAKIYQCGYCGFKKRNKKLSCHFRACHDAGHMSIKQEPVEIDDNLKEVIPLKCKICDKELGTKKSYNDHFENEHPNVTAYQCLLSDCNVNKKEFKGRGLLEKHMIIKHNIYLCKFCDKFLTNVDELYLHMERMHQEVEIVYDCQHCTSQEDPTLPTISAIESLAKEEEIMASTSFDKVDMKIEEMDVCESNYEIDLEKSEIDKNTEKNSEKESNSITKDPNNPPVFNYRCDISYLECTLCNKSFGHNSQLDSHLRINHGLKLDILKCHWCDYIVHGWKNSTLLFYHFGNVHQKFNCIICSFQTDKFTDMKYHDEQNHMIFFCSMCNRRSCGMANFDDHLKRAHKNVKMKPVRKLSYTLSRNKIAGNAGDDYAIKITNGVFYCKRTNTSGPNRILNKKNSAKIKNAPGSKITQMSFKPNNLSKRQKTCVCGATLENRLEVAFHLVSHKGLLCPFCDARFPTHSDINDHIQYHI